MNDDVRYSEFLFLGALAGRDQRFEYLRINGQDQQKFLGIDQVAYMEMTIALAEDLFIKFEEQPLDLLEAIS